MNLRKFVTVLAVLLGMVMSAAPVASASESVRVSEQDNAIAEALMVPVLSGNPAEFPQETREAIKLIAMAVDGGRSKTGGGVSVQASFWGCAGAIAGMLAGNLIPGGTPAKFAYRIGKLVKKVGFRKTVDILVRWRNLTQAEKNAYNIGALLAEASGIAGVMEGCFS